MKGSDPARWWVRGGLIVVVFLFVVHADQFRHYVNDDAYITFRYSRFLALGLGPYYNVGERVEGYTNFLLMILVAPVIAVFGPGAAAPFAKGLGVACGAGTIFALFAVCRLLARRVLLSPLAANVCGILAGGLVAISPGFAANTQSGLETALMAFCVCLGAALGLQACVHGKWRGAGIAFAAAVLTRPEGPLIFAVFWLLSIPVYWSRPPSSGAPRSSAPSGTSIAAKFKERCRPAFVDAVIVVAVFVGHMLFRVAAYDGQWLPNTYYAKAGGSWNVNTLEYVSGGIFDPLAGLLGVGVGVSAFLVALRRSILGLPLLGAAAAGAALPFMTGPDWMVGYRLLQPYFPLAAGICAVGWVFLMTRIVPRRVVAAACFTLAAVPIIWQLQSGTQTSMRSYTQIRAYGYANGHWSLAEYLRRETCPGDWIAAMDIGILGYECIDRGILDISGLTDRHIARQPGQFLRKEYDPSYVINRAPTWIVLVLGCDAADITRPLERFDRLSPWTQAEARLWQLEDFQRLYTRRRDAEAGAPWTKRLAAIVGAERVFSHAHPGEYYLLAAFRRHAMDVTQGRTTHPVAVR